MTSTGSHPTADSGSDDRVYIRVRPSETGLATERLTAQFEQLHGALSDDIIECLLVADPASDEISYYFGATADARNTLCRVIGRIFPDDYVLSETGPPQLPAAESDDVAVAELHGVGVRRQDWQTRLRPPITSDAPEQHQTPRMEDAPDLPLESILEGMAAVDTPVVYQALLRPKEDWGPEAEARVRKLRYNEDTLSQRAFKTFVGSPDVDEETVAMRETPADKRGEAGSLPGTRIDAILAKSARHSFEVNARILAAGPDAKGTVEDLAAVFSAVGGDYYSVRPVVHTAETATEIAAAAVDGEFRDGTDLLSVLRRRLPLGSNRLPRIVADPTTIGHFCLLDGTTITDRARRALRALPEERTGVPHPDADTLVHYDESGLALGRPLTNNGTATDQTVSVPPALQPLHVAWFGKTGSGKTTSLINAVIENHAATDGADVLLLPKGEGMPREYLRAHYAEYGDLDDVYYFDCSEVLPAISFFDIREQLEAGISRTTAVEDTVDHYIDILRGVMGDDRFGQAVRSPDVIRYLVKALFDPEYGADAFAHRDLQAIVREFHTSRSPPRVTDSELRAMLGNVAANSERSFDEVMQGVANRIEKIPINERLGRLFNHVPGEDDPHFDFRDILDEDAVVILDTGGLRTESQRVLALVLLSELWTALRRRKQTMSSDPPLVNLYLEEAASLAVSDILSDLLAQSRGFGLSVTLAMQFPGQLRQVSPEAYDEVLNNVSTIVTGGVPVDERLSTRLATADMPPEEVGNRLRALRRGQWFVSLPAPFDEPEPRPFQVESLSLPPGHPDGPEPLSSARETGFEALFEVVTERTRRDVGIEVADTQPPESPETGAQSGDHRERVRSTLPYTSRLPAPVQYDEEAHALVCRSCGSRYDPTMAGMRRAIGCCHDLESIDRTTVPICEVPLTLSPDERAASTYSDGQLTFLQAVYSAQQGRYDDLGYDLLRDDMTVLKDYVGVNEAAVAELIDGGLLVKDCDHPHTLYTVTSEGRTEIQVAHREGIAHGAAAGDVSESSLHTVMVEFGKRYLEAEFVEDGTSRAVEVVTYYEPEGHDHRLDAAAVAADGSVIATLEAERPNNDAARAIPADYDKMAAHEPEAAIWVVPEQAVAHEVLAALNNPADGAGYPRVEKMYSQNTPPQSFTIEQPGLTDVVTLERLRSLVDEG